MASPHRLAARLRRVDAERGTGENMPETRWDRENYCKIARCTIVMCMKCDDVSKFFTCANTTRHFAACKKSAIRSMAMPPPTPSFQLHWSNDLRVLAQVLAAELRAPAPGQGLLVPDTVLIPQAAMRRWLQAELAQTHGIAANLEFLAPGEFVRRALDANVPGDTDDLQADAMAWRAFAELARPPAQRNPGLREWEAYLRRADPLHAWTLAQEVAGAFEKYQAWRRDWLLAWDAGAEPLDAQATLWRHIAAGKRHRAQRVDAYLRAYGSHDGQLPHGLPARVFAFATVNVSPDVLRVIATQARVGALHLYVPTPSRRYWGDLRTLHERLRNGEDVAEPLEHPLLQAWGAAGRDFMAMLGGYDIVHPTAELEHFADPEALPDDAPERDTLLGRMQRDLLHRRAPAPWRDAVDRHDVSLQLHACHTPFREVQVLHDRLLALLDDARFDPPLAPREIAVLAPDIDAYAPAIAAVFGSAHGANAIPWTLADTSPLANEPLAEVFMRLLALPASRFALDEVLDVLSTPAFSEAAGLRPDDWQRLRHWLDEAGARWGLDAAHRARMDAPADDLGTWRFAFDRLLLGHASGSEQDIAEVAPWPDLEGTALDALDALIGQMRALARYERVLGEAMPAARWRETLLDMLQALLPRLPTSERDRKTLERLRAAIDRFADGAAQAGFAGAIAPQIVRAYFAQTLGQADTRAPLLSGGVSFGRMVPMRLIPFRVLCVLGMNDGEFPRRDAYASLNRIDAGLSGVQRRIGDRSLREDDRYLFLQLLAAAGEVFYVSYQGADPRDGSAREPSPVLADLLQTAAAYHAGDPRAVQQALTVRHALQPFSPQAFAAADDPRIFSYQAQWHAPDAANARRQQLPAWVKTPLDADTGAIAAALPASELCDALGEPPKWFLRQRMQVRLPGAGQRMQTELTEPLQLPERGWQRQRLQQAIFSAALEGRESDLAQRLRARLLLPAGALGEELLQQASRLPRALADAFAQWRGAAEALCLPPQEVAIDGLRLQADIADAYPHGLARVHFGPLGGRARIADGVQWLLLCAAGGGLPLRQFSIEGADTARHVQVQPPLAPIAPAEAQDALRALLQVYALGMHEPLPFGAYSGWEWYRRTFQPRPRETADAWSEAEKRWRGDTGWAEGDTDAARLALRGRDPFLDADAGTAFRAIATTVFDAVTRGIATPLPQDMTP